MVFPAPWSEGRPTTFREATADPVDGRDIDALIAPAVSAVRADIKPPQL
jgi:hypothetical protein